MSTFRKNAAFLLSTRTVVLEPADPASIPSGSDADAVLDPHFHHMHHNTQPLEVYMHYAAIERDREAHDTRVVPDSPWVVLFKTLVGRKSQINHADFSGHLPADDSSDDDIEKKEKFEESPDRGDDRMPPVITTAEKDNAYRALRVASWQAVFYLITTDILGFTAAPEAFQELGVIPGVMVFVFLYILAVFAGQIIWKLYLHLDSSRFPVTCYADLGERTFGRICRHIFNILQSFQLVFNVALLIVGNAQTLAAMIEFKFCYVALNVFFMIIGLVGGQLRSLKNFAWFASINIWLNIITMIITIVGLELFKPVPGESGHHSLKQPIDVSIWVPSYSTGWFQQVSGVQLAVFVYGGAMIFPEFMAEMRKPRDFWKSALVAQAFCFGMYMFFGIINYAKQGQYASILPNLDFANQTLILVNNVIGLTTTMIAAVLYGNIGVKVFYANVLVEYCKAPPMISPQGRWLWSATVSAYWIFAFIIGAAIPNLTALITLVGAAAILQFTYTFPPLLLLGFWAQIDAMNGDKPWGPGIMPGSNRIDTWRDKSRWKRGLRKYWYIKLFLFVLFVAALANCALGVYAGVKEAIVGFAANDTPFSCIAPGSPAANPKHHH